jgi:hypothetical protein
MGMVLLLPGTALLAQRARLRETEVHAAWRGTRLETWSIFLKF